MKKVIATFIIILIILISGIMLMVKKTESTRVNLETNYGNITINLYSDMPITSGNFKKLVEQGFYDGVIFHRIIDGFMLQGGDPQGTGMGGPGYTIKDEFTTPAEIKIFAEQFQWQILVQIPAEANFL